MNNLRKLCQNRSIMSLIGKLGSSAILTGKLAVSGILGIGGAVANDFTAGKVMREMEGVERYAFVAGVVEGLAIARYNKDGKTKDGMACIYDWFYNDKTTKGVIYAAFERFTDYPPGSVVDVLAKRKCGE